MRSYFADLHVHIGSTSQGRPVKITASRTLTFEAIVTESLRRKGMDMVAVVDAACPGVLQDIYAMVARGELMEMEDGGLLHRERLSIIPGAEVETASEEGGIAHHLCLFGFLKQVREFSRIMARYITNMELSTQRCCISPVELLNVVQDCGGVLIPAHCFTPHKSIYGRCARRMEAVFPRRLEEIPAIELGLSADTALADCIAECHAFTFVSNSDAHSVGKIAREYNVLELERPTFKELMLALRRRGGRRVAGNYGLDPRLGRYHRSFCTTCETVATAPPPVLACPRCGPAAEGFVRGVLDRIAEIGDFGDGAPPEHRPPYHYQVPLEFVPGLSRSRLGNLLETFGSEMAVLHRADPQGLTRVVGPRLAADIVRAREGRLCLAAGGGGHYGRIAREVRGEQLQFEFAGG